MRTLDSYRRLLWLTRAVVAGTLVLLVLATWLENLAAISTALLAGTAGLAHVKIRLAELDGTRA